MDNQLVAFGGLVLATIALVLIVRYSKQILRFLLVLLGAALLIGCAVIYLNQKAPVSIPNVDMDEVGETVGDLADIARVLAPEKQPEPVYPAPPPASNGWVSIASGLLFMLFGVLLCIAVIGLYHTARQRLAQVNVKRPVLPGNQYQPIIYMLAEPSDTLYEDTGVVEWDDEFLSFL